MEVTVWPFETKVETTGKTLYTVDCTYDVLTNVVGVIVALPLPEPALLSVLLSTSEGVSSTAESTYACAVLELPPLSSQLSAPSVSKKDTPRQELVW